MSKRLPHVLTLTRRFSASPARLFKLWTDPRALLKWSELRKCDIEARVGGRYRFEFPSSSDEQDVTVGKFIKVDPPDLLEFTWDGLSPSGPTGETLVRLEFCPRGSGCELRLRHAFIRKQSMKECTSGWEYWLDALRVFLQKSAAG